LTASETSALEDQHAAPLGSVQTGTGTEGGGRGWRGRRREKDIRVARKQLVDELFALFLNSVGVHLVCVVWLFVCVEGRDE
jgi:hypothetical protein